MKTVNRKRVFRVDAVLETYMDLTGDDCLDETLIDLLTDLRHWAQSVNLDIDAALRISTNHYECEK